MSETCPFRAHFSGNSRDKEGRAGRSPNLLFFCFGNVIGCRRRRELFAGLSEHQSAVESQLWTDVSAAFLREYLSIATGKFQEHTMV